MEIQTQKKKAKTLLVALTVGFVGLAAVTFTGIQTGALQGMLFGINRTATEDAVYFTGSSDPRLADLKEYLETEMLIDEPLQIYSFNKDAYGVIFDIPNYQTSLTAERYVIIEYYDGMFTKAELTVLKNMFTIPSGSKKIISVTFVNYDGPIELREIMSEII